MSIVLPAYNEEHRIGRTLDEVARFRDSFADDLEVLVVDDGSTDAVAAVARSYVDLVPELRVISHRTNRGKGRAVATGMLAATGDFRVFIDADGATPVAEITKLLAVALERRDVIPIGSIRAGGDEVGRRQPLSRAMAGRLGSMVMRAAVLPGVADSQRGCKLFPATVAEIVFGAQQLDGWGFDIEVLALCRRLGFEIVEVPVRWNHIGGGKISLASYASTLAEVMRVRRLLRTGAHRLPARREVVSMLERARA